MISGSGWQHALAVTRPPLLLAPSIFVDDRHAILQEAGIPEAVRAGRSNELVDWLIRASALQGISDAAAYAFEARTGSPGYPFIQEAMTRKPTCPRLRSYWHFENCGFRRDANECAEPRHRPACIIPRLPARKGALAVGAVALTLFVRDVADGDLIGWFDRRLAEADEGGRGAGRGRALADAVVAPLAQVSGLGPKVASMVLGDLLLAADPDRERWVAAGASMVAIDSLIHNFLLRTGVLAAVGAEHPYGPACHGAGGCAGVVHELAAAFDARELNPAFPAAFPRFVQFALWSFCAGLGWNVCNGSQIDDRKPCALRFCPAGRHCDRIALRSEGAIDATP